MARKSALFTPEITSLGVPESGPKRSLFAPRVQYSLHSTMGLRARRKETGCLPRRARRPIVQNCVDRSGAGPCPRPDWLPVPRTLLGAILTYSSGYYTDVLPRCQAPRCGWGNAPDSLSHSDAPPGGWALYDGPPSPSKGSMSMPRRAVVTCVPSSHSSSRLVNTTAQGCGTASFSRKFQFLFAASSR